MSDDGLANGLKLVTYKHVNHVVKDCVLNKYKMTNVQQVCYLKRVT